MEKDKYKLETIALHGGHTVDPETLSRGVAVHRTTSYLFKNTKHAARLFALEEAGNIYTRIMNPTQDILEKRVTLLEGGAASVAFASGTAAIFNTIINLAAKGDEIVAANNLYGGTYTMFDAILPGFGINTIFVKPDDPNNFEKAITGKTRAIYIETIGNPSLDVVDLEAVAKVAEKYHVPLVVDATFTTPALLKTIDYGAKIVINSLTKWMGGHGTAIGGMVTDAGTFDWGDKKFILYNEADPNYHGMKWIQDLPEEQRHLAFALRLRTVLLRNLGSCISPDNAWIFLQGLETLPLRMERHCGNALRVAQFLAAHRKVDWVRYPGLLQDLSYKTASRYLKNGFGGMVVFGIRGGREEGGKFIDNLKLFSHLANVGDAKSLAIHPASTTHSQLSVKQLDEAGVLPSLIRLSVGIEHIDDIISDIDQALTNV